MRKGEKFDLDPAKSEVKDYLSSMPIASDTEKEFGNRFGDKEYAPELLFDDSIEFENVKNHPMALWKCR